MMAGLLTVLSVLTVRGRFDDPDMWWHLKTGQIIFSTHTIPVTDLFSYTTNHHSWIPHEWLAQLSMYLDYKWFGLSGLMLWLCVLTAALLIAAYGLCALYSGNVKLGFVGAMVVWIFATSGLAVRPQLVGYLLLIVELLIVHLGKTRTPRWFLALPPLFAIWINCHGSFFLGLMVLTVFLFASFFQFRLGPLVAERWTNPVRNMLLLAFAVSFAALFLNPVGIRQILYPLDTLFHQPLNLSVVEEWSPLRILSERGIALLAVLSISVILVVLRKSELFLDELLLLALGTEMAFSHARMAFVFGILAAPVLSRQLSKSWDNYQADQDRPWANAVFLAVSLLVVYLAFPSAQNLVRQAEEESPVKAVQFIQAQHLAGPMLNDYTYGGYLIWAAPEYPVFLDGRGDVFEWTGILSEFGNWATRQSDPNTLLNKYKINFVLLSHQSPMAPVMPTVPGWKQIYSDNNAVIFLRTAQ
jgi:hypothetical protein